MKHAVWLFGLLLIVAGCVSPVERAAWEVVGQVGDRNGELARFLEHYRHSGDKERYQAACFLVANMLGKHSLASDGHTPVYDVDVVKADSLIASLEYSFALRERCAFLQDYSFEQFCEYVLPYRVANEPLQYYWKWDCARRFGTVQSEDMTEAARQLNARVRLGISPEFYGVPQKSYSEMMRTGYGKCDDRATLLVMALRSAGIPSAFEFVPYWGSSNNGHSFGSLVKPDGSVVLFQNDSNDEEGSRLMRKVPKVYRKTYALQRSMYASSDTLSDLFRHADVLDVTAAHEVGCRSVCLPAGAATGIRYLSVFSPGGWLPVAFSASGEFRQVGTGLRPGVAGNEDEALQLGNGILYLPSSWSGSEAEPVAWPVIVSADTVRVLQLDTLRRGTVLLERKYPLSARMVRYARNMVRGVFEVANTPDFSDARELYRITDTPQSRMQRIRLADGAGFRYVRYRRPAGRFSLAELRAVDSGGHPVEFIPMLSKAMSRSGGASKIFDSDPLTYFEVSGAVDLWAGMDLKQQRREVFVEFAPRNDDNAVSPGDVYELFYWDNGWMPAGRQQAEGYVLRFDNVPLNALFWLRNLTRGHEERPFTYEGGRQVWW